MDEPINPKWNRREITTELAAFGDTTRVFHQLNMGRISTAVYLTGQMFGRAFLAHEEAFRHSNLEVYSIRVGSVDGIQIGYLFRSPLGVKVDPYFVVFRRRGVNVIRDIILSPKPAEKKYVLDDLVFHVCDSAYLITRLENNGVTKMLSA